MCTEVFHHPNFSHYSLFLQVCLENSCTKSASKWGAAMPRYNCRKEERNYEIFSSQSPCLTSGTPMDSRASSGMELAQTQRQTEHWAGNFPLWSWLNMLQQNSFEGGLVASPGPAAHPSSCQHCLSSVGSALGQAAAGTAAAGASSVWLRAARQGLGQQPNFANIISAS